MKPKTLVLLCVAVGCGLVAMIGVQQALNKPAEAKVEMAHVLEATVDIDPGVPLTEEYVTLKEIARESVPEDAVTSVEDYQQRSLMVAAVKGEYILKSKLSAKGVSGKSTQIPIGKNIITINVDETNTASNMMKASDIVDVSVTFEARTPTGMQSRSLTLLECVPIFALADQTKSDMARPDANSIKARQVSLIVDIKEANAISLAQRKGVLTLTLRNPMDTARRNTKAMTEDLLNELRGLDKSQPTATEQVAQQPAPVAEQPKQDIHSFLAEPVKPVEVKAEPVAAKPESNKDMWEVKVYVGNDIQTYAFEVPKKPELKDAKQDKEASLPTGRSAGELFEKFGWSLPWAAKPESSDAKTNQAL
jgi:pilus assembly protein CpaB